MSQSQTHAKLHARGNLGHAPNVGATPSVNHRRTACTKALSMFASDGISCSSHVKLMVAKASEEAAITQVAHAFGACQPLHQLGCTASDLATREHVCGPYIKNNFSLVAPVVELAIGRAGSGIISPLLQCAGVATDGKCQGSLEILFVADEGTRSKCLAAMQPYFVKLHPDPDSLARIRWLQLASATLGGRGSATVAVRPKMILLVRNPFAVVHSWAESALGNGMPLGLLSLGNGTISKGVTSIAGQLFNKRDFESRLLRRDWVELLRTPRGQELVLIVSRRLASSHALNWGAMLPFSDTAHYDALGLSGEELRDPQKQPTILRALLRHVGLDATTTQVLQAAQAMAMDMTPSYKGEAQALQATRGGTQV